MNTQIILKKGREDAGNAVRFLDGLAKDKAWLVEVRELRPRRSDEQNRYLWGVVYPAITERLEGWTKEDVHEYCLGECFGWETVEGLGRKRHRPLKRSSRLSKTEFVDYVDFIQRRMAGHGIYVPDPGEE